MLSGENAIEQQDTRVTAEPAEGWTDRYGDEGDEHAYHALVTLAGNILAFVTRRLPQDAANPAEAAMRTFLAKLIDPEVDNRGDDAAVQAIEANGWKAAIEDFDVASRIDW